MLDGGVGDSVVWWCGGVVVMDGRCAHPLINLIDGPWTPLSPFAALGRFS